jgi:cleavage and polyadenylation specificity factor subunit 3
MDAVSPIRYPRSSKALPPLTTGNPAQPPRSDLPADVVFSVTTAPSIASDADDTGKLSPSDKQEIKRLINLGIPVPGVEIKFEKYTARVWLEDLDVECANKPLKERIKALLERSAETVSGLWT